MDWYPWYPALYRADTMHLTAEQDGVYRRLIDHYMETRQPLPDSDNALSRIAGVSLECWQNTSSIIRAFFRADKKGFLNHKRCDEELYSQDRHSNRRSQVAKHAANKRWQHQKDKCSEHTGSNADAMLKNATGQDRTGDSKKEKKGSGTRFALQVPPEEWVNFCSQERPDLNPQKVFEFFRDYWISQPGQRGVKLDWFATWRNWIRNQKHENTSRNATAGNQPSKSQRFKDSIRDTTLAEIDGIPGSTEDFG